MEREAINHRDAMEGEGGK